MLVPPLRLCLVVMLLWRLALGLPINPFLKLALLFNLVVALEAHSPLNLSLLVATSFLKGLAKCPGHSIRIQCGTVLEGPVGGSGGGLERLKITYVMC